MGNTKNKNQTKIRRKDRRKRTSTESGPVPVFYNECFLKNTVLLKECFFENECFLIASDRNEIAKNGHNYRIQHSRIS